MKPLFGLSGIAMCVVGFFVFTADSICAQYLPPVIGNAFQSGTVPDFVYPEKKPELKALQENQSSKFIYREYEAEDSQPQEQYQIILTPVAEPRPQSQPPKVVLPGSAEPQQLPGMSAQTIYYFPPPAFPDPVPLTIYRPMAPQPSDEQVANWSPYNNMYGPPMLVQPQHFGPPKHDKGRRFKKDPGMPPGEPVVGPPVLVYPNGIVVKPKIYMLNQPFKNMVRAFTP